MALPRDVLDTLAYLSAERRVKDASIEKVSSNCVARLVFRMTWLGTGERLWIRDIHAGEQFDIGRRILGEKFSLTGLTISKHEFRIRCVLFDEDDSTILPMVYLVAHAQRGVLIQRAMGEDEIIFRRDGARLLNSGDVIEIVRDITARLELVPRSTLPAFMIPPTETTLECVKDTYWVTPITIGSGAFARVVVAKRKSDGSQLACKVIPKRCGGIATQQERWQLILQREVEILRRVDHPNVASVSKVLQTPDNTYIFQELATGGDLLSYQHVHGCLPEPEVLCIAYQLVQAVNYLHDAGIVHRDIKPENILLTSWQSGGRIILADFGQARDLSSTVTRSTQTRMWSVVGTEGWQAPEMRCMRVSSMSELNYGMAVDMWSLGSVTFACLTGNRPDENMAPSDDRWQRQLVTSLQEGTQRTSTIAVYFHQACLFVNESRRLTAREAKSHFWFNRIEYKPELESAYKRAIATWTSRTDSHDLIEESREMLVHTNKTTDTTSHVPGSKAALSVVDVKGTNPSIMDFVPPRSSQMLPLKISPLSSPLLRFARVGET